MAYEAVTTGGYSVRRAAEEYQVPRSTLYDRVSGKVQFGAKSGSTRYLNDQEESELVNFLLLLYGDRLCENTVAGACTRLAGDQRQGIGCKSDQWVAGIFSTSPPRSEASNC